MSTHVETEEKMLVKMKKLELIQQPDGREAGMEFEDKCVDRVGGTKGKTAVPKQAHGEALLKSAQDGADSDRSVHASLVKTEMTGGACSTGSLTAGVATLPATRVQKAVLIETPADELVDSLPTTACGNNKLFKKGNLDFDLGNMLTLGVVEYTRVRMVRAGAQGLDLHGNNENIDSFDKVDLDSDCGSKRALEMVGDKHGSGSRCMLGDVKEYTHVWVAWVVAQRLGSHMARMKTEPNQQMQESEGLPSQSLS